MTLNNRFGRTFMAVVVVTLVLLSAGAFALTAAESGSTPTTPSTTGVALGAACNGTTSLCLGQNVVCNSQNVCAAPPTCPDAPALAAACTETSGCAGWNNTCNQSTNTCVAGGAIPWWMWVIVLVLVTIIVGTFVYFLVF